MNIHIETPRILMRDLIPEDAEDMFEMDSDPEVHKYLGGNPIKSRQEAEKSIEHVRKQYEENGIGRWAIIEKSTDTFLGWSGLKLEKELRPNFEYIDLGYRLKRKHWGKGFATESARESLRYGFGNMNLEEICAAAHVGNIASNRILAKLGMKFVEQFYYEEQLCNWYNITRYSVQGKMAS